MKLKERIAVITGAGSGIGRAVADALSREGSRVVLVDVDGAATLADYAQIGRLLQGAPGVRHADLVEAHGTTVAFNVRVRGGSPVLDRALAASGHFAPAAAGGARLHYEYRP